MRVLQVSDGYAPATGGLERTVQALAHQLASRGHRVEVATLAYPGAPETELEADPSGTGSPGVAVHRLRGLTRHLQRFSTDPGHHFHPTSPDPQLVRRLQEVVDALQPDVVHAHGWMLSSAMSLRLPPGCALVATLHDHGLVCAKKTLVLHDRLDVACPGPSLGRCLSCTREQYGALKGAALTLGLRERHRRWSRVSLFLPISEAVAAASLADLDPSRYAVVPSFVDDGLEALAARTERPDFVPEGDFVLFVGALGEHKGLGVLAEAHRRMRHAVPLVVVGAPRADTVLPVGGPDRRVVVRSGIDHAQIMATFAAAAVAVVPSRWPEPQGLVAVEAMSVGRPVVASRVGGLAELVPPAVGVLVAPGDAGALAGAVDALLDDPGRRDRLGAAGREHARAYTAAVVVPRVLDAYARARAQV